jgi:hypothetical protein
MKSPSMCAEAYASLGVYFAANRIDPVHRRFVYRRGAVDGVRKWSSLGAQSGRVTDFGVKRPVSNGLSEFERTLFYAARVR